MNLGDFAPSSIVHFKFTTVNSSGVPTTLSGSPALSVYGDASTTQSTTGITLTPDFDGIVGLNHVTIDLGAAPSVYVNFGQYAVVITTGTVGGSSVVGYVLVHFGVYAHPARGTGGGTVTTGATVSSIPTSLLWPPPTIANQFKGRIIIFDENTTTAALRGQGTDIKANTSGGTLTVTDLTTAPVSGDTFILF